MAKAKSIWLEDKYNLLKGLLDITRRDFLTVLQLFLLMFIAGMMYFSYFYLNTKIEQINKTVNPDESKAVIESSQRDTRINDILDDLRVETNADRSKLFQFHNGTRNLQSIPFLYASVTHERIGQGVSSEIQSLQRIPSSIFADNITYLYASVTHERIGQGVSSEIQSLQRIPSSIFADNITYFTQGKMRCTTPDTNNNDAQRSLLERQRIKKSCSFGVFDKQDITGFITVNFIFDANPDEAQIEQSLRKASIRITDVLGNE